MVNVWFKRFSLVLFTYACCYYLMLFSNVTFRDPSRMKPKNWWTSISRTVNDTLLSMFNYDDDGFDYNYDSTDIQPKYNVLFMIADDMRAQLECYEGSGYLFKQPEMKTPNFNRLAAKSLLLKNAYVQYALCGPSRTSMLTSRRPDTTRVYDNSAYWRATGGDFTTLPQYFKEQGYTTLSYGKVFQRGQPSFADDPVSWSERVEHPKNLDQEYMKESDNKYWFQVEEKRMHQMPLIDSISVDRVIDQLHMLAPDNETEVEPFFMALGFYRPHASQVCPKNFFDMYRIDKKHTYLQEWEEKQTGPTDMKFKQFRKAYYACISYVDSLVGEVLDTLEATGLQNNTIVVFVSDHGYHYGEHGWMGKSMTYDMTTRVPLMIHIPGLTDDGVVSESIVEAVDIFPTVVEAAELGNIPKCNPNYTMEALCTEGKSFMSLIENPDNQTDGEAYSQRRDFRRKNHMYYSIRTAEYRFSQWAVQHSDTEPHVLDPSSDMELYDHVTDHREYNNLAQDKDYDNVTRYLRVKLQNYINEYHKTNPIDLIKE